MRLNFTNVDGSNKGGIVELEDKRFLAVTATSSKEFKTLNGAKKFMSKLNYSEVM